MRLLRALALTMVASCRAGAPPPLPSRPAVAVVRGLGGTVHALRAGAADWGPINDGAQLYADDRLRTFAHAWAQLELAGGSSLRVDEESLIALGDEVNAGRSGITIERGTVAGELAAGMRVRTPTLEAETTAARDIRFQ